MAIATKSKQLTFNITPNPRILEVIANNPMPPINALCELIDNSLDGFAKAKDRGQQIEEQSIAIDLPARKEIETGIGRLVIKDNGPGLGRDETNNALRAGYSGNNAFDNLGLFGVGFNIATAKLGAKTVFKTARKQDDKVLCVEIDIPTLVKQKSYDVPFKYIPKPTKNFSGVEIEISGWWPEGNANAGYVKKLVSIGIPQLTRQIGRRYSYLLRKNLKIKINGEECKKFYHCVWDKKRYVERQKHGKIPARFDFCEDLGTELRCLNCSSVVAEEAECPVCGSGGDVRPRKKQIKGWVGIQRFDDQDRFGLDFIRNGRAILIDEKEAVFVWTTEKTGEKEKEYPVDGIFGRIVGEVRIDHVPTDFMKIDFQRTHNDWAEVIKFLRGESFFQPRKQAANGEPPNDSPLYKLFQGYRKVRKSGTTDMYMGYWDETANEAKRVTRDVQEEYEQKFLDDVPGYGPKDDSKWWEQVEAADFKPQEEMKSCPECGHETFKDSDVCNSCGYIYNPKNCIKCKEEIPLTAARCPKCGENQVPDEDTRWVCSKCMGHNPPDSFKCRKCGLPRGVPDNFSVDYLLQNSTLAEDLSKDNVAISLPGEVSVPAVKLKVYQVGINLEKDGFRVPAVVGVDSTVLNIFLDTRHPVFQKYLTRPQDIISIEIAHWVRQQHESQITDERRPLWSPSHLFFLIHSQIWGKTVELDAEEVSKDVKEFFARFGEALPGLLKDEAENIYDSLEQDDKSRLVLELNKNNVLDKQKKLVESGEYLSFLPIDIQISLFRKYADKFFTGNFWKDDFDQIDADPETINKIKDSRVGMYYRCLDDMYSFLNFRNPDSAYILKINHTLRMVMERLV